MRKLLLSLSAVVGILSATYAQTPVSITGTTYTQNFNTLDTTSAASTNLPAGWSLFEKGSGAAADQKYKGNTGTSNTGDTYSYGLAADADRALGSIASSSNTPHYGVKFANNSANSFTSMNVQFYVEQWRYAADTIPVPDSLMLEYSLNATGINDTTASWFTSSIVATSPLNAVNATATTVNGNLAANRTLVSGTINITVPIGSNVCIRWRDINIVGSDDGLGIDDLNITFGTAAVLQPNINSTNPVDNATGVGIGNSSLTITFDKNITIGNGNIYVKNLTDGTQQTIAVANTSVSGATATIPNVTLLASKSYAVQYDSTCYKNGTTNGVGIYDNTTWNFFTLNPRPIIITKLPADNATNVAVSTSSLSLDFDKNLSVGTGNFYIVNITDATIQTVAIGSCTVAAANITIPSVTLTYGKSYAVLFDSTCVNANGNNAMGIYDSTTWNFSTEPPITPPVTSLNETFTGCTTNALGAFVQKSQVGSQTWRCSTFGHNDANAVYMNSGATPTDNTDWLISPTLNLSGMNNPMLNFWSKKRFTGTNTKEVYVSNNYLGDVTTATWTLLNVNGLSALDTLWTAFNNNSLNAYKNSNMHIAFKYVATATGTADEWTVDDVNVTDGPVSSASVSIHNMHIAVIGQNSQNVQYIVDALAADQFVITIHDVLGNVIYSQQLQTKEGRNYYTAAMPATTAGIYVLTVQNAGNKGIVKFVKQ